MPPLARYSNCEGPESNDLILWGPVAGQADEDPVIGVYAPDLCTR